MLTIELAADVERELSERAKESGRSLQQFAKHLLENAARQPRSLEAILTPIWNDVNASGISDEELDHLFEEARNDVHAERHGIGS